MKQQFNVNLESDLVRRVKHAAIDAQLSLSDLVAQVIERHLDRPGGAVPLTLQPMVHVQEMAAAVDFYTALGATVRVGSRDGDFTLLDIGGSQLGLLAHPPNPEQNEGIVELNFESTQLDDLETRLRAAGVEVVTPASDEAFGRQLQVRTPDGLLVKINELEPELFS